MIPRAVLFDLDDTLIDRRLSILKYTTYFAEEFSVRFPAMKIKELDALLQRVDNFGYTKRDDFFLKLADELPWSFQKKKTR